LEAIDIVLKTYFRFGFSNRSAIGETPRAFCSLQLLHAHVKGRRRDENEGHPVPLDPERAQTNTQQTQLVTHVIITFLLTKRYVNFKTRRELVITLRSNLDLIFFLNFDIVIFSFVFSSSIIY